MNPQKELLWGLWVVRQGCCIACPQQVLERKPGGDRPSESRLKCLGHASGTCRCGSFRKYGTLM